MSAEPQNIRTAFGHPAQPILPKRTLADYEADLTRRFGKVPSWTELADMENAAMRNANPRQSRWTPAAEPPRVVVRKVTHNEIVAARNRAAVMGALINGMTTCEVANASGRTREGARGTLRRLLEQGIIYATTDATKNRQRWYWSDK